MFFINPQNHSLPPHHPKPHTRPLPQPHKIGQRSRASELHRKAQFLHVFVRNPFLVDEFRQAEVDLAVRLPVHAVRESEQVIEQRFFQKMIAVGQSVERFIDGVIVAIQRLPFMNAISKRLFKNSERVLFHFQPMNSHRQITAADAQAPFGLREKMVRLLHPIFHAKQHRAHRLAGRLDFVLNQWITMVKTARFSVVVVKPVVLETYFLGDGSSKLWQLPRRQVGKRIDRTCRNHVGSAVSCILDARAGGKCVRFAGA